MNTQSAKADNPANASSLHVVIVGGGIAGLSAAWYLQQTASRQGIALDYTLVEQSERWGGKVYTEQIDTPDGGPFILEIGADAFLTRKPWALTLARDLGLSDQILPVNTPNNRTFVLRNGKPLPLPDGLQLLAPTRLLPFLRSPLFSPWGKARALLDLVLPPRRSEADETLARFVRRRLGAELLDRVGEPMLAGVYNGDSERQSMMATFPQFPALEKQHGSLIRGLMASQRNRTPATEPPFISFKMGASELVRTLVAHLHGTLHLNTVIRQIDQRPDQRYRLLTAANTELEADAIILATPAHTAAALLSSIAPEASAQLGTIPYAGIGTAYFAYRGEDVPHPMNGFGLVIPRSEGRSIDGVTWTSSKWNGRAPSGYALLRVFFGGPRARPALHLEDSELLTLMRAELASIFGISAKPVFHRIYRWQDGYPQYNMGHLAHVTAAESALPAGIFIAGSAYRGVGVPDCVYQGQLAAEQAIAALTGQKLPAKIASR